MEGLEEPLKLLVFFLVSWEEEGLRVFRECLAGGVGRAMRVFARSVSGVVRGILEEEECLDEEILSRKNEDDFLNLSGVRKKLTELLGPIKARTLL